MRHESSRESLRDVRAVRLAKTLTLAGAALKRGSCPTPVPVESDTHADAERRREGAQDRRATLVVGVVGGEPSERQVVQVQTLDVRALGRAGLHRLHIDSGP